MSTLANCHGRKCIQNHRYTLRKAVSKVYAVCNFSDWESDDRHAFRQLENPSQRLDVNLACSLMKSSSCPWSITREDKISIVECHCEWEVYMQIGVQKVMCLIFTKPIRFEPHTKTVDVYGKLTRVSKPFFLSYSSRNMAGSQDYYRVQVAVN